MDNKVSKWKVIRTVLAWAFVFFILGYLVYVAGATVVELEELQSATGGKV